MHENCTKHSMPKSNVEFWTAKLTRNRERDRRQHAQLKADGWRVIDVWECELAKATREERLNRLYDEIVVGRGSGDTIIEDTGSMSDGHDDGISHDAHATRETTSHATMPDSQ